MDSPTALLHLMLVIVLLASTINNDNKTCVGSHIHPSGTAAEEAEAEAGSSICSSNRTYSASESKLYVSTSLAAMDAISPLVSQHGYGKATVNYSNITVYAFGECIKHMSTRKSDCDLCFIQCKSRALTCLLPLKNRGGMFFCYDRCYLRYDDYIFFNENLSPNDKTVCGRNDIVGNQSLFRKIVDELGRIMSTEAPKNGGFFTGSVNRGNLSVYGLAQCWEPIVNVGNSCKSCLSKSVANMSSCALKDEARALNVGCYIKYSTQKFYDLHP